MVPTFSIIGMTTSAVVLFLLPILTFLFLRKKFRLKLVPVVAGIAFCFVFVFVLEQSLHSVVLQRDSSNAIALIKYSPFLYVSYSVLASGVFEETARFLAFHSFREKLSFLWHRHCLRDWSWGCRSPLCVCSSPGQQCGDQSGNQSAQPECDFRVVKICDECLSSWTQPGIFHECH